MPRSSVLLLALAAALLAACGTPKPPGPAYMSWYEKYPDWKPGDPWPDETGAPSASPPIPVPPPAQAAAPTTSPQVPAPQRQTALPPSSAPQVSRPNREPPPEPPKLEELRGLDGDQLTALLGKPTLMRNDANAQMWQYRAESCVLHLFLYPGSNNEKRVQYVEARSRQTGAPAVSSGPSECLAALVGARRLRS